ncbi:MULTISPECIES: Mce protein [Mycobacterium]|uniref:Mce protein n=1 Tax=Mycobacterium colombiense TaxID=339268 RepID=A0A329LZI9_9MYCO|nr:MULTISPECIES: Mce protein [Mycobacterium]MDM4139705.1 Mce protein [Mycobacterium sp. FLAC0960]RAV13415.1 Mce protein [Mycobacterium colombiense]
MQLMNHHPALRPAGSPRTWLVNRFRLTAAAIEDGVTRPPAAPDAETDEAGDDATPADASPDTSDDAERPADERPGARKYRRATGVRWATAAVLAVALTGSGYEGWLLFQHHQKEVAAAQALAAAKKYILTLTSVDTNAIDKNFTDVLDGSTGEFKDMYTKSSAQLRQTLIDNKAAAHGSVIEAAVQSATEDKVDVVLFVDQSVSNGSAPAPQLDRSRVRMTMEKVDGRWLASRVELP